MKAEGREEGRATILPVLNQGAGRKEEEEGGEGKKKSEETLGQREEGTRRQLNTTLVRRGSPAGMVPRRPWSPQCGVALVWLCW